MDMYVFANQKGGVGKATIALGLASALARRAARVLLIDLDPQASATKVIGIDTDERCTVADALLEPERYRVTDAVIGTGGGLTWSRPKQPWPRRSGGAQPLTSSFYATSLSESRDMTWR